MKLSYGTWKSRVENFLYNLCSMKLKDFEDYPYYREEFLIGLEPREAALSVLEFYGFPMEFEEN